MNLNDFLNTPSLSVSFTKVCARCEQTKDLSEFNVWTTHNGGTRRATTCFSCVEAGKTLTKLNGKQRRDKWANKYPDRHKLAYTRSNWSTGGVVFSDEQPFEYWYERYLSATHCEITGRLFDDTKMGCKCLDHEHKTGRPRGIICGIANLVLGKIEDSTVFLKQMEAYLNG